MIKCITYEMNNEVVKRSAQIQLESKLKIEKWKKR